MKSQEEDNNASLPQLLTRDSNNSTTNNTHVSQKEYAALTALKNRLRVFKIETVRMQGEADKIIQQQERNNKSGNLGPKTASAKVAADFESTMRGLLSMII